MRSFLVLLALALPGLAAAQPINAVVGDASWVDAHGRAPDPEDDEIERIRTHLAWIGAQLRAEDTSELSPALSARRTELLDALDAYRIAGRFPRNTDHPGRRPRFVDDRGHLCAVGHLIFASVGMDLVNAVNGAHEYDYLPDMDLPALADWVRESGFSARELAMIQPQYGFRPPPPSRPEPPRIPERPPLDEDRLQILVRRETRFFRRCAATEAPDRVTRVRIMLRVGRDNSLAARVQTTPRSPALERCIQMHLRRRLQPRLRRFAIPRPIRTRFEMAVRPDGTLRRDFPTEAQIRSAVHQAMRRNLANLRRCLPNREVAGRLTLRIRVTTSGSLELVGASLPPDSSDALPCLARIVASSRVQTRPRDATTIAHSITLGRRPTR